MRRLLAILLFAAFGLPVVAPLLAMGQDLEAKLPACCRRNGAHHCSMGSAAKDTPGITAECPRFPQPASTAPHSQLSAFSATHSLLASPQVSISSQARAETQRRVSRERSRHKRGPPAAALAA